MAATSTSEVEIVPTYGTGAVPGEVPGALERIHSKTGSTAAQQHAHPALSKWDTRTKILTCHTSLIIAGWSDAGAGPLIPYIQTYFGISYTIASLLFVAQCIGFGLAAMSTPYLASKLGIGRILTLGCIAQIIGLTLIIPGWNFALMCVCFGINGFGEALADAAANSFIATMPNVEHQMAFLHASYGFGAVVCPIAATAFAASGIQFSYFYILSVGLMVFNTFLTLYSFRFSYRIDESVVVPGAEADEDEPVGDVEKAASAEQPVRKRNQYAELVRSRPAWLFSTFLILYVGAEVGIGGWIVTYIEDNRNGGPNSGYVSVGFWAGVLLGRATLSWFTVKVGEKLVIFIYLGVALAFEFGVWFCPGVAGPAVMVALVGYMLGPCYPLVMVTASKVFPRRLLTSAIGFCASFGSVGGAVVPFAVGGISSRFSPAALQPVVIVLFVAQIGVWLLVPDPNRPKRKSE